MGSKSSRTASIHSHDSFRSRGRKPAEILWKASSAVIRRANKEKRGKSESHSAFKEWQCILLSPIYYIKQGNILELEANAFTGLFTFKAGRSHSHSITLHRFNSYLNYRGRSSLYWALLFLFTEYFWLVTKLERAEHKMLYPFLLCFHSENQADETSFRLKFD